MSIIDMPYTLVRTRRKTIALIVSPEATVTVRAPMRMPESVIVAFVRRHGVWIARALDRARKKPLPTPKRFVDGESLPYLGVSYPLTIVKSAPRALTFSPVRGFSLRERDQARARMIVESWYREAARAHIASRAALMAAAHGIRFRSLKITSARRRWGSCSSAATLNFSWRTIMAPEPVVDYVIAHELSHIRHMNHSRRFWRQVGELHPHYARERAWLSKNGHALIL